MAQNEQVILLEGVSKKYQFDPARDTAHRATMAREFLALRDISLAVGPGSIMGVIGRNGAGKTTLLNIIAGVLAPSAGRVSTRGKVMGLFNLGVGFQDELTGRENIFLNAAILGATRKEVEEKLDAIVSFSELGNFINMPLGSYSQGMRLRLGFGIITNLDFDVLVIDEVLAVGDILFQYKCYERLMDFKRAGKTLVISTQSMDMIERLCDAAALLDHGNLLSCGEVAEGIRAYRTLLDTEKFFVSPKPRVVVEQTKRWADDTSSWGRSVGTKEIVIEKGRVP